MIGMKDLYRWGGFFRVRVEGGIKRFSFINRSTVVRLSVRSGYYNPLTEPSTDDRFSSVFPIEPILTPLWLLCRS